MVYICKIGILESVLGIWESVFDIWESVFDILESVFGILESVFYIWESVFVILGSVFGICKSVFRIRQLSQCRSSICWWRLVIASVANQHKRLKTLTIKNNENNIDEDIQQIQNKDNQQGPKR